jgi:hypothetical protein
VSQPPQYAGAVSAKPKPVAIKPAKTEDVALVWGKTKGGGMNILRKRADRFEAGIVEPLKEGAPIHGEVVQLHPRADSPLYDVEVHVPRAREPESSPVASGGPPQVATDAYRKNWDSIYKSPSRKLLN